MEDPWPDGEARYRILDILYSVIVMKLNLTTGKVPTLNISVGLTFVFLWAWTELLRKAGVVVTPFTPQENTVMKTCIVAYYSIAVEGEEMLKASISPDFSHMMKFMVCVAAGGFGSYLLGLDKRIYELVGVSVVKASRDVRLRREEKRGEARQGCLA